MQQPENKKHTRVLMTADAVGGVWTYSLDLARGLGRHGVEVFLVTMGPRPTAEQLADAADISNLSVLESDFRLEWMQDCWADVDRAGDQLLQLEQEIEPDVIHLNGYCHADLPFEAPTVIAAHSCILSWWHAVRRMSLPKHLGEYRRRVTAGLRAADAVVAPTRAMLNSLKGNYCSVQTGQVIYNGRDSKPFRAVPKERIALTAGRLWDEAKNVSALMELPDHIRRRVYVAGDVSDPSGRSADLQSQMNLLGRLSPDAVARWMSRVAVYALPARYEPFGLSALEAAMSGSALVLGDIPSLREVWGEAAIFVDPDEPAELAEALSELLVNDDLRESLSAKAVRRAEKYSVDQMARGYIDLYSKLVSTTVREEVALCA